MLSTVQCSLCALARWLFARFPLTRLSRCFFNTVTVKQTPDQQPASNFYNDHRIVPCAEYLCLPPLFLRRSTLTYFMHRIARAFESTSSLVCPCPVEQLRYLIVSTSAHNGASYQVLRIPFSFWGRYLRGVPRSKPPTSPATNLQRCPFDVPITKRIGIFR